MSKATPSKVATPSSSHKATEYNYVISSENIAKIFGELKTKDKLNIGGNFSINPSFGFEAEGMGGQDQISFCAEKKQLKFLASLQIIDGVKEFGFDEREFVFDLTKGFLKFDQSDEAALGGVRARAWSLLREAASQVGSSIEKIATIAQRDTENVR